MSVAALLIALLVAGAVSAAAPGGEDAVGAEAAAAEKERAGVALHCFRCASYTEPACGDPFNASSSVPITEYPGKSVCYKFKKEGVIVRGGMLDSEYLDQYESGLLDEYPRRGRCFNMLCNAAPALTHARALTIAAPLLLLLLLLKTH